MLLREGLEEGFKVEVTDLGEEELDKAEEGTEGEERWVENVLTVLEVKRVAVVEAVVVTAL